MQLQEHIKTRALADGIRGRKLVIGVAIVRFFLLLMTVACWLNRYGPPGWMASHSRRTFVRNAEGASVEVEVGQFHPEHFRTTCPGVPCETADGMQERLDGRGFHEPQQLVEFRAGEEEAIPEVNRTCTFGTSSEPLGLPAS